MIYLCLQLFLRPCSSLVFSVTGNNLAVLTRPWERLSEGTHLLGCLSFYMVLHSSLDTRPNLAPPTTFEIGKFGLALLHWGEIMPDQKLFRPIKLSGRALYDDGHMINSNVITNVTKERLS